MIRKSRSAPLLWIFPLVAALTCGISFLPEMSYSQAEISISDFKVLDWFKAVKLTWRASAPEGTAGIFQVYRSDTEKGPYKLVQEIQYGDKAFIDVITKNYSFLDQKLESGKSYYYKLALQGGNQVYGPFRGLASGSPPGT